MKTVPLPHTIDMINAKFTFIKPTWKNEVHKRVWIKGNIFRELIIVVNGHSMGINNRRIQKSNTINKGYIEKYFRNSICFLNEDIILAKILTQKILIINVKIVKSIFSPPLCTSPTEHVTFQLLHLYYLKYFLVEKIS